MSAPTGSILKFDPVRALLNWTLRIREEELNTQVRSHGIDPEV